MLGEIFRVARHAREPARTPSVEPWQSEEVGAGNRGDPADMARLTAPIEDRKINPSVVGAKPDAPHDTGNAGGAETAKSTKKLSVSAFGLEDLSERAEIARSSGIQSKTNESQLCRLFENGNRKIANSDSGANSSVRTHRS